MRRLYILMILFFAIFLLSGCQGREKLLILNWGEYINEEVVLLFEEEYNVDVIINIADSNEMFYSKIKSGTTAYDLVIPSEYMIDKMVSKELLQKINLELLENFDLVNNPFLPGVIGIQNEMFPDFSEYSIPYMWGTFGLMYNKNKLGLEDAVRQNSWKTLFEADMRPADTRVGMYNVPRFAYASALFYNGLSPNLATDQALEIASKSLTKAKFNEWGTDTLKKGIAANNLDLAFLYTGDFLDMLYVKLETTPIDKITFDIYIPDNTIAFMDSFVIPKKARHVELAHKFIDFFLRPEMAYLNASVIGYCTPLVKTYEMITNYNGDDEWLNAWAYATKTYYPRFDENSTIKYQGEPLINLERDFLTKIDTMFNNAKVK